MPHLSVLDSASAPDVSSTFQCVFRLMTHLPPPDLSSALPPTMVPSSACLLTASPGCRDFHCHPTTFRNVSPGPLGTTRHPPWHPPHRCIFCCTAAHSGHTTSLPLLCRILWLHHCISHCSAMPSGCSTLLTHCTMLHLRSAIVLDPLSACTTLARYVVLYLTCIY